MSNQYSNLSWEIEIDKAYYRGYVDALKECIRKLNQLQDKSITRQIKVSWAQFI